MEGLVAGTGRRVALGFQQCLFVCVEQPRANEEAHAAGGLDAEPAAPPRYDVDGEVGVLPVRVLRAGNIERRRVARRR